MLRRVTLRAAAGGLGAVRAPGAVEALASGVGFGLFYLLLGHPEPGTGPVALTAARIASVVTFVSVALVRRGPVLPPRGGRRLVVLAGLLDGLAGLCFLASAARGPLPVAAVLTSFYPAATIALARLLDHERCSRGQLAGLGLAAVSVGVLSLL